MLYTFKAAHIPFHHYNEYRQAQQTSMCLILKLAILNFKSGKMIGINYLEVQFFTHKYAHFIVKLFCYALSTTNIDQLLKILVLIEK